MPFPDDFAWLTKEFWQWVDTEGMPHEWVKTRLKKYRFTFKANGARKQDWTPQVQAMLLEDWAEAPKHRPLSSRR